MPEMNKDTLLEFAYRIRVFERKLLELSSQKKIAGTIHTCIGQEINPVAIIKNLNESDVVISNHRGHGHFLAKTKEFQKLASELIGNINGVNKGIGGSQHIKSKNFYASGIQGAMLPFSLGISFELKKTSSIVVAFVGDGTFGQGVLYEVLNWASLWSLPILFVVEDNGYAQSTKRENNFSGSFKERAKAFDINFFETNSFMVEDLLAQSQLAVNFVRKSSKPAMIHIETYRLAPHSKGDDLRDSSEINLYLKKDEITKYELNLTNEKRNKINEEIHHYFEMSDEKFESIPKDDIFKEITQPKKEIKFERGQDFISKKINQALKKCFEADKNLLMIGEDIIDPYGGAFKITQNLSSQFPDRVLSTPISEAAIIGFAAGRSSQGKKTIAEIMFGDFFGLAYDQFLNVISKYQSMYGEKIEMPLTVRMPIGPGGGYGPTHSQEVSQYLSNIPFIEHRFPTAFSNIEEFYWNSIFNNKVIIIYEAKRLYRSSLKKFNFTFEKKYTLNQVGVSGISNFILESKQAEITILIHPFYSTECEGLLDQFSRREVDVDIFIPECLNYFAFEEIKKSLVKTKKLFVWDSGFLINGRFVELIRRLQKEVKFEFSYEVVPMASIPASSLEDDMFYNFKSLISKIRELYEK